MSVSFEEIREYVDCHFRDVSLSALEREFHYSKDVFGGVVKAATGMSFVAYLQSVRLGKAIELLTETSLSARSVADAVGYNNMSYFYKIFMARTGLTPGEYRRKKTQRNRSTKE